MGISTFAVKDLGIVNLSKHLLQTRCIIISTLNLTENYFPGGTLLGFHSTSITLTAEGNSSSEVVPVVGWVYDRLYQTYLPTVLKND